MKHVLLKSWLMLLCLLVGVGTGWAETKSIEINTTNSGVTGSYADKTFDVNDVTFGFTQWMKSNNIQAKKSTTNSCYNVDAIPGNIKKITVVQTGTARAIKIYGGTSSKPTTEITAPSTAATMEFDFSEKSYTYFSMTTPGNAVYINTITIEYETSGGSSTPDTRTAVNMTGFSATSTTLIKGNTTTTTVTNDQNGWTPAYTYESNNKEVATVSNTGVITAVAKGTAKITASLNIANNDATWKKGATSSKTVDITVNNPSHTAHFSVNGTIDESKNQMVEEGENITFPADPSIDDVTFMGWTDAAIDGSQDDAPSMVDKSSTAMGDADVTYFAVFATKEEGDPEFKLVSSLTNGKKYVFVTRNTAGSGYALSGGSDQTLDITKGASITITESGSNIVISGTPDNTIIWTAATGWSLTNNGFSTNNKLVINGSSFTLNGTGSSNLSWTTNYGLNGQSGSGSTKYYVQCTSTGTFSKSSTSGSTTNRVYAYEESAGVNYSDYCTTVSLDPQPTIVLSATELTEYAGNTNSSITASVNENEYTGDLTVQSSAEGVATASISEGAISIQAVAAGSATITVTAPAVTGFRKSTATIAVTVKEKLAHGLSFSADALNLTVGDTEFTEPTLSNPNNLPVVYSLVYATPANEGKVATINEESGKITLAGLSTETQGVVTVKASTVGDDSHAAGEATYKLVVARKVSTTTWSNGGAAVNIDKDEIATLPTASNDAERNLFYESNNEDVATIDNTGAVTFVAYGTTTITAKTSATSDYAATSATYELTFAPRYTVTFNILGEETILREETTGAGVTAPTVDPIGDKVFRGWAEATIDGTTDEAPTFVTTTTLDGDKTLYAVFATASGSGEGTVEFDVTSISGIQLSIAQRAQTTYGITFTFSSVGATGTNNNTVQMSKNSTLTQDKPFASSIKSISFEGFSYSGTSSASMLVEGKNGVDGTYATVQSCGSSYTGTDINFGTNDYNMFKISVGSERTVKFTKMTVTYSDVNYSGYCTTFPTVTISITTPEGYSTFVSGQNVVMPTALKGSAAIFNGEDISLAWEYPAGSVVPANTPILVKGEDGVKDYKTSITSNEGTAAPGDNRLFANTTSSAMDASAIATDAALFYTLSYNKNHEELGFYWRNSTGASFSVPTGKVFLAVPAKIDGASPKMAFVLTDDGATSIDAIKVMNTENNVMYNLAGQRVNANAKGIVIKNGKKMLNK